MASRPPGCKCNTGAYCHLHKQYAIKLQLRYSEVEQRSRDSGTPTGQRIIRKSVEKPQ